MSLQLPAILSPPTPCIPSPALTVSPLARSPKWLRPPHANSPMHQAVSCLTLLYLWTGSSSPVASPPAFRRRSFLRLRTASVLSDGDFHPTVGAHSQAHVGLRSRATGVGTTPRPRSPLSLIPAFVGVFTFYGRATPVTRERDPTKPVARPMRAPNAELRT